VDKLGDCVLFFTDRCLASRHRLDAFLACFFFCLSEYPNAIFFPLPMLVWPSCSSLGASFQCRLSMTATSLSATVGPSAPLFLLGQDPGGLLGMCRSPVTGTGAARARAHSETWPVAASVVQTCIRCAVCLS
jgi:hypothetical protein